MKFQFKVNCGFTMGTLKAEETSLRNPVSTEDKDKDKVLYDLNSPAVTTHLSITAEIVNRLANNSNYCKTVCIAVVAAFAAIAKDPEWKRLAIWSLPVLSMWILDSLFVFLKKRITEDQKIFVQDIMAGNPVQPLVLKSATVCQKAKGTWKNMWDISTWLFYFIMLATLALDILLR